MKLHLAIEAWSLTQWYLQRAGGGGALFTAGTACTQAWSIVECEFRLFVRRLTAAAYFKARYHSIFSAEDASYHCIT